MRCVRRWRRDDPYNLICLDIMMPEMDGYEALKEIRRLEAERGILSSFGAKVFMTTALDGVRNVAEAFESLCDIYLLKPVEKPKLLAELRGLNLIA